MPERVSLTAVHDQTTAFPLIWPQVRDTLLTVVQTEYEVNRSIIGGCTPMQAENLVFGTLTAGPGSGSEPGTIRPRSRSL